MGVEIERKVMNKLANRVGEEVPGGKSHASGLVEAPCPPAIDGMPEEEGVGEQAALEGLVKGWPEG